MREKEAKKDKGLLPIHLYRCEMYVCVDAHV